MTAAEIAARRGGAHPSGDWWRCRCPVHGSRGPTLTLRDGDRKLIAVCHAGCARGDILAESRRRGLLGGRSSYQPVPARTIRAEDFAPRRIPIARRIWTETREARGTPMEAYLVGRGITTAPPASLRYAPTLRCPDGTYAPAMVARIDDVS